MKTFSRQVCGLINCDPHLPIEHPSVGGAGADGGRAVARPFRTVVAGALMAVLLPALPARAAELEDWPEGDWAASCDSADATFCIESATLTPVGGEATPLDELGLTAHAGNAHSDVATVMSWGIDGWDEQAEDVIGGTVSLVIRTGSFVPRWTTATARDLQVRRDDDVLTITGQATQVAWSTEDDEYSCLWCDDHNSMADEDGTGYRFQGQTQDLAAYGDLIPALDGGYTFSDAQMHSRSLDVTRNPDRLYLGPLGNPQLDVNGEAVHNFLSVWLPNAYFTATGYSGDQTGTNGVDLVSESGDGRTLSRSVIGSPDGAGVLLNTDIANGADLGDISIYNRKGTSKNIEVPGGPNGFTVTGAPESVLVSWEDPEWTGGLPTLGYRARAFSAETGGQVVGSCEVPATEHSCEIADLTDGETYYVATAAHNAVGESYAGGRAEVIAGEPGPEAPSEPRDVRADAGPGRVTVSWSAPVSDGGAPVDYYTVRGYRSATSTLPVAWCEAVSPARTCALNGVAGRLFTSVTATNEAGDSPESARPSATPWTAAGVVRGITAKSSRSKITVAWTAPAVNGGTAITGYRADLWTAARGGKAAARCTASGTAGSCTTGALKAGQTYWVSVTALNAAGSSAPPVRVKVAVRR